jgi:hypothetical protein
MPGLLFHVGATALCPHAGQVVETPANTRVLVSGQPVVTMVGTHLVVGCPMTTPGGTPQPCMTVQWLVPAVRVQVMGAPVILNTSASLCVGSPAPGPANVIVTQPRVKGT